MLTSGRRKKTSLNFWGKTRYQAVFEQIIKLIGPFNHLLNKFRPPPHVPHDDVRPEVVSLALTRQSIRVVGVGATVMVRKFMGKDEPNPLRIHCSVPDQPA
jgi:hypothetical protein